MPQDPRCKEATDRYVDTVVAVLPGGDPTSWLESILSFAELIWVHDTRFCSDLMIGGQNTEDDGDTTVMLYRIVDLERTLVFHFKCFFASSGEDSSPLDQTVVFCCVQQVCTKQNSFAYSAWEQYTRVKAQHTASKN